MPSPSDINVRVIPDPNPPIIKFQLNNPVKYIKLWWKKVMSKEGIDLKFRIHPVTAILIASIIAAGSFGVGRISNLFLQIPFLNNIMQASPSPTPTGTPLPTNNWEETGLKGTLHVTPTTNKYYLLTTSSTAISLQFDKSVDLSKYIGKRILASGSYNSKTHVLIISDILDLEVLPTSPVPIVISTPNPTSPPLTTNPTPTPF